MGLMGEAGPEAIMPLARGADGKLGVRGGGGGAVNITMNISTPDVAGFASAQRRRLRRSISGLWRVGSVICRCKLPDKYLEKTKWVCDGKLCKRLIIMKLESFKRFIYLG